MPASLRAAISVAMLAGFYLLGLVQLAVVGVLLYVIWTHAHGHGPGAAKLSYLLIAGVGVAVAGLWRAMRARPGAPGGLLVTAEQAPALWQQIHELAGEMGTRGPDEIRLIPDVNAGVTEETKLLGLIPGRRILVLGLPLLQALSVDQLRAVIGHELGHYSGAHTRLGAIAYRGRLAMHGTVDEVSKWNVFGWAFRGYAWLYRLVSTAVGRDKEYEADRAAVRVAGPAAAISALREVEAAELAWNFYFGRYVEYGLELGYAPDDLFGGFGQLYTARADELAEFRDNPPEHETSRWDTHPSLADRTAAMRDAPVVDRTADDRPATVLVPDATALGLALQREVVDFGRRTVLPWPDFTAAATTLMVQGQADRVFRSVARRTGVAQPGLAEVLALVENGKLGEVAAEFFPDATRREAAGKFVVVMDTLIELAAVRSGLARWQHSWSGPARLVGTDGEPVDYSEIAKLAVAKETLDEARARLAETGIRVEAVQVMATRATATGADVLGAMPNAKVDGGHADVILLDKGLVFVPCPKDTDDGEKRIAALLAHHSPAELAARYRYVAYEDVETARIDRQVPLNATLLLHGGQTVTVQERWTSDRVGKSDDVFRDILTEIRNRSGG
jgi:Zn-dependent protease with chaperone function